MAKSSEELLQLKNQIMDGKSAISEINGSLTYLYKTLKDRWNEDTKEKAEVLLEKKRQELAKLEEGIEKATEKIQEQIDEIEER